MRVDRGYVVVCDTCDYVYVVCDGVMRALLFMFVAFGLRAVIIFMLLLFVMVA